MKIKKGDSVYRDDNPVDFSRKSNVTRNNSLISRKSILFSPEDQIIETGNYDGNPSVNKTVHPLSRSFNDDLNRKSGLLNKGFANKKRRRAHFRDLLDRLDVDTTDY